MLFVLPWVVVPWPWVGITNREFHGQTVRVGRSVNVRSAGSYKQNQWSWPIAGSADFKFVWRIINIEPWNSTGKQIDRKQLGERPSIDRSIEERASSASKTFSNAQSLRWAGYPIILQRSGAQMSRLFHHPSTLRRSDEQAIPSSFNAQALRWAG